MKYGFNEAPIHESGKLREPAPARPDRGASMRPRFMNRGSPAVAFTVMFMFWGFNEAPIHESGKSDEAAAVLFADRELQ